MKPAPVNHGYKFQRIDLPNKPIIEASLDNVVSTTRNTTLEKNGVSVILVEHVLSALRGMDIDNCLIQVNGPEIPILDGSALWFCNKIIPLTQNNKSERIEYINLDSLCNNDFKLSVRVDFSSWTEEIGIQYAYLDRLSDYMIEIAPARTFTLLEEDSDTLLGSNSTNTILFSKSETRKVTNLRFKNEVARHKLLDVIGDLALLGKPIRGSLILDKPGHTKNIEYAKKLLLPLPSWKLLI